MICDVGWSQRDEKEGQRKESKGGFRLIVEQITVMKRRGLYELLLAVVKMGV